MADFALEWNDDFQIDPTGDISVIDGDNEVHQRLERRLFTAVQGYVWHPEYGAGLPQKIGSVYSLSQIQAIVSSQIQLEETVATNPPPVLNIAQAANNPSIITISIKYWDSATGISVSFTITA